MRLTAGTRLGPYEIVAPLGAGGMGEVYAARDTRLGRDVAVKVLPQHLAADGEALARFEREARAVAALSHPNILAIHDFGVQDGTAYSVTEMLEGKSLSQRMGGAALPARKVIDYSLQIARGLAAAHDKGIVHRDLKPDNIFVTDDGRLKILDFGLAKLGAAKNDALTATPTIEAATLPGTIMGTMGYMSPEQVRGQALDHRSDIFAFGAILYEMISGRRAFRGETTADTMSAILKEEPPEMSTSSVRVPPALERIVHHCLEKSPAERFQSARDLAFDLEAITSASGAVPLEAAPGMSAASGRGRRLQIGLAIGLAAGLAIGAGGAMWIQRPIQTAPPTLRNLSYSGLDREPSPSPDGRLIAYASTREGRSQIWLKQYPGGDEVALTSGPEDGRPRMSPDGSTVLFARGEASRSSLFKVPVVGGEPRKVLDDAYDGDWAPDSRRIVFLRQAREKEIAWTIVGLVEASGEGAKEIARVLGGSLDFPRWSPDGGTIAASHAASENAPNSLLLIEVEGGRTRTLDPPPPAGLLTSAAWSGAPNTLVYGQTENFVTAGARSGSGRILLQEISSGRATTLMWVPALGQVIDIVGEGRILLSAPSQRQNLLESPLDGGAASGGTRWLTRGNSIDRQPTFSPDGQWVLFSSNRSGNLDLWKLSTTSGAVRRITEDAADDWDPAFTPDGRQIVWSSNRAGHFEVWICAADGTGARQLTDDGVDAENPTATRDGRWIVYNSTNPAKSGLWKIHPDGSGAVRIVTGTWSTPDVSPDGAYVAFRAGTVPRRVWVARIEDGEVHPFTDDLGGENRCGRPRWMPDGRGLAYTGTNESGALGVFVQPFVPGQDTQAARRALTSFQTNYRLDTFGISPDGRRLIVSELEESEGLMLAEGLQGIVRPSVRR